MKTLETKQNDEFLETFNRVINKLAKRFTFGYYEESDIKQEAFIFALEAQKKWDGKRPLENFMYTHIKNQLINLKRDLFHRADSPCSICGGGGTHEDGKNCQKYLLWKKRNTAKSSLMSPANAGKPENAAYISSTSYELDSGDREIFDRIRNELPHNLLTLYLRWKAGENISKQKKELLILEIRRIFNVKSAD